MKLSYSNGFVSTENIGYEMLSAIEFFVCGKGGFKHILTRISVTREEIETSELNWGPYLKKQLLRLSYDEVFPKVEIKEL